MLDPKLVHVPTLDALPRSPYPLDPHPTLTESRFYAVPVDILQDGSRLGKDELARHIEYVACKVAKQELVRPYLIDRGLEDKT